MMNKKELTKLKKEYEELTKYYKLQASLKISEESRGISLKLAKRYEELDKIISREIQMIADVENLGMEVIYTCKKCGEQFVCDGGETVNYCWNCGQRLSVNKERKDGESYYDLVMQSSDFITTTIIAKDYGMTVERFNIMLNNMHIQFRLNGNWALCQEHAGNGYTAYRVHTYKDSNGMEHTKKYLYWSQKGRLFLYDSLKQIGILPEIEKMGGIKK